MRLAAALLLTALARPVAAQEPIAIDPAELEAFADSFFAAYVDAYHEPSLAVTVVRSGAVLLEKGYGWEDSVGGRPVDARATLFNVASLSKLVTATAAMQQVERGRLDPHRGIDEQLGTTLIPDSESRIPDPVTPWHLLTHTSGLDAPFLRDVVATPAQVEPLGDYLARHPPRRGRPPGREIRYSNTGFIVLGHVVERASGGRFEDVIERDVLAPLGMTRSTFRQPPPDPLRARVAIAGAGPVPDALRGYPAGSLVSTAHDMGRFVRAHLGGGALDGARVLADTTVAAMHATQFRADARQPGVALGFFETDLGGRRALFHTGARVHFSLIWLSTELDLGVFVVHAMRQGGEFQTLRTDFVRALLERFGASGPAPAYRRMDADARYAGVYRPILLNSSTIERAAWLGMDTRVRLIRGRLRVEIPGGPVILLAPVDRDLYRGIAGPHGDLTLSFQRDARDRVTGMTLAGGTQDPTRFERLAWWRRGLLHAIALGAAFALFLVYALAWPIGALVRSVRGTPRAPEPRAARIARIAARATATLVVLAPLVVAALVLSHHGDDTAGQHLRSSLTVGLSLLLLGAIVSLSLPVFAALAWRRRWWTTRRRVGYSALAVAALVALPLLAWYHLLGFHF